MAGHAQSGHTGAAYIPALRFHWLTPIYDLVLRWAFPEKRLKRFVVEQVGAPAALLDMGCGTGTLTRMLQSAQPATCVVGLDIDGAVLAIAQHKSNAAEVSRAMFVQGSAIAHPFDNGAFDCVATSLVMHHLSREDKAAALRECHRVLRPGGVLLLADFAAPRSRYARTVGLLVRYLEEVEDNMRGRLPVLMAGAGFADTQALAHFGSVLGTLTVYRAVRP